MYGKNFNRQRPGKAISARTINRPMAEAERFSRLRVGAGLSQLNLPFGIQIRARSPEPSSDTITARIVARGDGAFYSWHEVYPVSAGNWSDGTNSGSTTNDNALEQNNNTAVPAGTRVRMFRVNGQWTFQLGLCNPTSKTPIIPPEPPQSLALVAPPPNPGVVASAMVLQTSGAWAVSYESHPTVILSTECPSMAGLRCVQTFSGIAGVASAYKTVCQIKAPSNQRLRITAVRLACEGITTTDPPVLVRVAVQSSAGTGGSAGTPVKLEDEMSEAIQTTAQTGPTSGTWTAEPTTGNVKYQDAIHPQGRIPEVFFQPEIWVKGGDYLGLLVNVGSGAVNSFSGSIYWEE